MSKQQCTECKRNKPKNQFSKNSRTCDDCIGHGHYSSKQRHGVDFVVIETGNQKREIRKGIVMTAPSIARPVFERISKTDTIKGPHTGQDIPVPPTNTIPLEKYCNCQIEGDALHQPCRGKWKPWNEFSMNNSKRDGLQDVCDECKKLRNRNSKRKSGLLSASFDESIAQLEAGREMAKAEAQAEVASPVVQAQVGIPTDAQIQEYINRVVSGYGRLVEIEARNAELEMELQKRIESESVAMQLAEQSDTLLREAQAIIEEQKAYQRMLVGVGMNIPPKYRLIDIAE